MKFILLGFLVIGFGSSGQALAHGEDKAGPHGGFVRMPGAFHTEVVPSGERELKVYLLDVNFKSPMTQNSTLKVTHALNSSSKKTEAICSPREEYFICKFKSGVRLKQKGKLIVLGSRDGQKGIEVTYPLPLKLEAHH